MTTLFSDDKRKRPLPADEKAGEKVAMLAAIALLALLAGAIVYSSNDPVQMANNAMSQSAIDQSATGSAQAPGPVVAR